MEFKSSIKKEDLIPGEFYVIREYDDDSEKDEFISFFYPHKKLKKFRIWEIKI